MARGTINTYKVDRNTGVDRSTLTPTTGDTVNGHTIPNKGVMWIEVHNTNAGSTAHTLTTHLVGGADGQPITPKTKSIAATKTILLGPFPAETYGGHLNIDVDHAELTITAFELVM